MQCILEPGIKPDHLPFNLLHKELITSPEVKQTRESKFETAVRGQVGYSSSPVIVFNDDHYVARKQETISFRSSPDSEVTPQSLLAEQREKNRQGPVDTGHEFHTYKQFVSSMPKFQNVREFGADNSFIEYHGTPLLSHRNRGISNEELFGNRLAPIDVGFYGAQLINNAIPTKSVAQFGVALGELLDEVPNVPISIGRTFLSGRPEGFVGSAGKDFLSYQYSVAPLIKDVQDICRVILTSGEIIRQYLRDAGLQVRRKRSLPVESVSQDIRVPIGITGIPQSGREGNNLCFASITMGGTIPYPGTALYGREITRTTNSVRFSGSFSYFLDTSDDIWSKLKVAEQLANKLLGTRLTPEVLWELTPFSWLADWYANIGTIVSNASHIGEDGLVLNYGYLMHQRDVETIYVLPDFGFTAATRSEWRTSYKTVEKHRYRATPYGFARNPESFNGKQWAILGALGLTKAPRKLS